MKRLPKKIKMLWGNKANGCEKQVGVVYTLKEEKREEQGWEGYWSVYYDLDCELPPTVHYDGRLLFLCSMEKGRKNAESDMMERLEHSEGQWEEVE